MKYITEILSPEEIEWAKQKFIEGIINNATSQLVKEDYPEPRKLNYLYLCCDEFR